MCLLYKQVDTAFACTGQCRWVNVFISQWTQNICITFVQCWTNVEEVVQMLSKCFFFTITLLMSVYHTVYIAAGVIMIAYMKETFFMLFLMPVYPGKSQLSMFRINCKWRAFYIFMHSLPAKTIHQSNVGPMLDQRRRRWTNIGRPFY